MSYIVHRRCTECGTAYSYDSGESDRCPSCSLTLGMAQAAAGQLEDRGAFAQYLDDHACEVVAPWNGAAGFNIGVVCATCGPLGNTGAMDASDARGVARRHESWWKAHGTT